MPTLKEEDRVETIAPDDRAQQARSIAQAIEHDASERTGEDIELEPQNGAKTAFDILWNGQRTGRVQIFIPRATYGPERTRFALQPPDGSPRNYVKQSTLITKIINLCRPPGDHELRAAQRRAERAELEEKINAIEGGTGSITRYLHAHRMALAAWMAGLEPDTVPPGCHDVVCRMRDLVLESARLRAELASLE